MIDAARRDYPGLRFKVGSMADLPLGDASVAGLLAFWSLAHIPNAVPVDFRRVLGPGGPLLLGFHAWRRVAAEDTGLRRPSDEGVRAPPPARAGGSLLRDAGFAIEAQMLLGPDASVPGAVLFARRQP
jgi:hypothetical protein